MNSAAMPLPAGTSRVPSHPRRRPAHQSVSLLHAASSRVNAPTNKRRGSSASSSGQLERASDSPSSLKPLAGRGSSGESSNADTWFDKSNNGVHKQNGPLFVDHDPPFFMRNSPSDDTPPGAHMTPHDPATTDSLPMHTGLLHLGTDGGSTEDYRGVIDDLTVQNKKLKRKLKKYEQLHDSHLKDEKLFEVRIHGLPPQKKRELEEMLCKFASSLGTKDAFPTDRYDSLLPMLKSTKHAKGGVASSQASLQPSDSAYASMTATGQGSATMNSFERPKPVLNPHGAADNQSNIHSYLHDIPAGLLPRQNPTSLSERARKKLVVRKVEQLFAGKGAVGGHHQALQQQDVSQSAARADRTAYEASGKRAHPEGLREASVLKRHISDPEEDSSSMETGSPKPTQPQGKKVTGSSSGQHSSDQRPTRPLDLDPERAQIPVENVQYMRHMGFSPAGPDQIAEEGHGWIYINFLINMAQLHTLNVTTSFVRDAILEMSGKMEISEDGRKLRWKGGSSITRTSSHGDVTPDDRTSADAVDGQSPRKRPKLMHDSSNFSNMQSRGGAQSTKHAYTPLFLHNNHMNDSDSDVASSASEASEDRDFSPQMRGSRANGLSGMTSSGVPTSTGYRVAGQKRKKPKHDNGPIIFYNNARFCTDLSGERKAVVNPNPPKYTTWASRPLGDEQSNNAAGLDRRGPLDNAYSLPEPMHLDDSPTPQAMQLSVEPFTPPHAQHHQEPIDMEVTGMAGVYPADNFAIDVERRHAHHDPNDSGDENIELNQRPLPSRFARIFRNPNVPTATRTTAGYEITGCKVQRLEPSALPPAIAMLSTPSTEESSDADSESDLSTSFDSLKRAVARQPVDFAYASDSDENGSASEADADSEESDDDDDDDGEVDFLAAARRADPELVRQQEREYDANIAERLAEEIPAGSSAATAGGGSGFNSPATGVSKKEYRRAMQEARKDIPVLKREKSDDSTAVQGLKESVEERDMAIEAEA